MTCTKCARRASAGESWCDVCRGPLEFSARERESMQVDVRARVLWADPVESIREEWLKKGAPAEAVREAIHEAVRERHRHFRMRGLQDVLIALACFGLAAGCLYLRHAVLYEELRFTAKGFAFVMIGLAVLPVAGLWFGLRGVRRLRSGGKGEKGASDLGEFDL